MKKKKQKYNLDHIFGDVMGQLNALMPKKSKSKHKALEKKKGPYLAGLIPN